MNRRSICTVCLIFCLILVACYPAAAKPPAPVAKQEITVSPNGDGDFATITEALDSITDASESKRYLVIVKPGIYNEIVTMKAFVDIAGSNVESCIISDLGGMSSQMVLWNARNATLSNITVQGMIIIGDGTTDFVAVMDNVKVVFTDEGIRGDNKSRLEFLNSRVIMYDGIGRPDMGIRNIQNSLIANSIIEMNNIDNGWSVGLTAVNTTVRDTIIKINTPFDTSYGVMGGPNEIVNCKISVETVNGNGVHGVNGENYRVLNSDISVSVGPDPAYVTDAYAMAIFGTNEIHNSVLSGVNGAIVLWNGTFKAAGSQLIGGHNGIAGNAKVLNCYDADFNPLPDL